MSNRHERRKAAVTSRKKLAKLKTATLDQHLDDILGRVRAEFERTGEIDPRFECVTAVRVSRFLRVGRIVVQRLRHTRRSGIAFVAGG